MCFYPVLKAGDADGEELQQTAQLRWRHVHCPALDQILIGVLDDPQETHEQIATGLCCQHVASFPRLDKKTLLNNIQKSLTVSLEYVRWTDKYPYILLGSLEYLIMIGQLQSNILYAKLYTLISLPVLLLLTETKTTNNDTI